ncbi:SCO family protein [Pseudomonas sp. JM0905a]|uniref:SCO family protein n=1 Tax=Metapseudomonas resinovorans TaxID=53412 RepID=A0ABT4Y9T6_METRE|nr:MULTISPECIES: SCO family protein [Pseudomonas]MBD2839998.1 SCO family protein [Pseudomonas sp. JM0905a]MDA8485579.1 SCO family protein [Pseudomonas resinovorans]
MNTRRNLIGGLGAGVLGLAALGSLGAAAERRPNVHQGDDRFPNPTLVTHLGRKVRFYDDLLRGKVVVLNMMYASCGRNCPTATANLRKVQRMLGERVGRDIFMYSITLQPELDQPHHLQEYVDKFDIGPGWEYLTGDPQDILDLRYALGFYDVDPLVDGNQLTHTGMVRIGNEPIGRWTMSPALTDPEHILAAINHVDHRVQLTGWQLEQPS